MCVVGEELPASECAEAEHVDSRAESYRLHADALIENVAFESDYALGDHHVGERVAVGESTLLDGGARAGQIKLLQCFAIGECTVLDECECAWEVDLFEREAIVAETLGNCDYSLRNGNGFE